MAVCERDSNVQTIKLAALCPKTRQMIEPQLFDIRDDEHSWLSILLKLQDFTASSGRYFDNDRVTVQAHVTFSSRQPLPTLHADLARMQQTALYSDVTLVVEDTQIPAHRCVLVARSPVFKAMFSHKMSEALEGKVMIDELQPDVIRAMLRSAVSLLGVN